MSADSAVSPQAVDTALGQVMAIGEIVYAGLWLGRPSEDALPVLQCVGVRPEETPVHTNLSPMEDRLQWVLETSAFNWTVSGTPVGRREVDARPCTYVTFALDRQVLLEVCVLGSARVIASRIDRIHAALSGFSRSLVELAGAGVGPPVHTDGIDLEFVEAAAMGDHQFVRQILDIAAEEIVDGVSSLREAAGRADRDAIRFQAHRIRSTARTVGAGNLDTRMAALETACSGDSSIDDLMRHGVEEAESVLRALRQATSRHK